MALRLTALPRQDGSASAPASTAQTLALQARTALAAGDVTAYSALFDTAGAISDPHRCLEAQLALLQAGLVVTAHASEGVATRVFVAMAEAALGQQESEPVEPLILNLAGVALYELWSLDAAEALFRAARRLDPELADAERNLREVARRKRAQRRATRPLHAAVPGLARRAKAIAADAAPATGLTLSLCMIVRDEEQMLPRCLAAVAPAVDEMVIVDTGSTDATVEIARSFGAKVIEFPWTGSFAEARNVSFEAATGDWLLYLDADEVLVAEDAAALKALTGRTWREAFMLVETNYLGDIGDGAADLHVALRMFRNRPEYRFKDRLHEQIAHTLPNFLPNRVEQTAVRIEHYGYLGAVREAKEKSRRNVELLRRQADEAPATPFLHFNLGSEYAAAGNPEAAVAEFQQARALLGEAEGSLAHCTYGPIMMTRLAKSLYLCKRLDEADAAAADALELFPDHTELVALQARIAQRRGDADEMVRLLERCIELGDAPARYGPMVGAGTYLPRIALAEVHLARGETARARSLLEWCVENHPSFLAVAGPYVSALLRDGAGPEELETKLERLTSLPPMIRLAVAAAFRESGAPAAAERQLRRALAASPANPRVRTGLGELLLARGAWEEAAEIAAPVADDDPYAGLACRIELCGLVGRADGTRVRALLDRADRVGLPRGERAVFEAWVAIGDGGPAPEGLPLAGAPALGVILDTLLGGGDIKRFNALVPALQGSRLPRREQRELLAGMFLSHGLLAPAAREWMAVCSDQPDARALVGLARVARRNGMPEDAATFATGALELEPGCPDAQAILDSIATASAPGVAV